MTPITPMTTLGQIARWLPGAHRVGDDAVSVLRVHTDTRTLAPGDLFVALSGERFDGNDFLPQARLSGAVAALCHATQPQAGAQLLQQAGLPGLVVPDTLAALGHLATAWRAQFSLPLIAVTGSNGKTTVTQMIAAILAAAHGEAALATQGNWNNAIGVPLTLLGLRAKHARAVLELGMNHPGEIAQLAAMAQATVALVNNAQREHQEFMHSIEAVAQENGAVLSALGPQGVAVFPADDAYTPLWRSLAGQRPQWTFALDANASAEVRAQSLHWQHGAWQVQALTPAGLLRYRLRVAGRHNVKNSLAAAACALAAGLAPDAVARGLEAFEPVPGRSRALALDCGGRALTLVDDSYNANPDSVRAAIDVLAELPGPSLLVLGDMGEVGARGPQFHAEVGAYARARGISQLLALGTLSLDAVRAFGAGQHCADMASLQQAVRGCLPQVQTVLVKGSRFMRMERVVQAIRAESRSASCC